MEQQPVGESYPEQFGGDEGGDEIEQETSGRHEAPTRHGATGRYKLFDEDIEAFCKLWGPSGQFLMTSLVGVFGRHPSFVVPVDGAIHPDGDTALVKMKKRMRRMQAYADEREEEVYEENDDGTEDELEQELYYGIDSVDTFVSRRHFRLEYNRSLRRFEIKCLGKNGLFVNGVFMTPASPPIPIYSRTCLDFGRNCRLFYLAPSKHKRASMVRRMHDDIDLAAVDDNMYNDDDGVILDDDDDDNIEPSGAAPKPMAPKLPAPTPKLPAVVPKPSTPKQPKLELIGTPSIKPADNATPIKEKKKKVKKPETPIDPSRLVPPVKYVPDNVPRGFGYAWDEKKKKGTWINDGSVKPPFDFNTLATQCLSQSPHYTSSLPLISKQMRDLYPYFRLADKAWQSSLRHALSNTPYFVSCREGIKKTGEKTLWTFTREKLQELSLAPDSGGLDWNDEPAKYHIALAKGDDE